MHAAEQCHFAQGFAQRRHRKDRHTGIHARHPQRGRAGLCQCDNRFYFEMQSGKQCGHGDRLIDAGKFLRGCAVIDHVVLVIAFGFGLEEIRAIASMVSTGKSPTAVSADNITASVPSNTAFATSDTSARVGIGLVIIDSIICVAVITRRFFSRAILIMRFCNPGTAASPTSTLKSPRATMMASDASMISLNAVIASARSILAINILLPPAACIKSRAKRMSSPVRGKDTAR